MLQRVKTALICQEDEAVNRIALPRWMNSFSDLAGVVVIREPKGRKWTRVRKEIGRIGLLRFLDVFAYRVYYRLKMAKQDMAWEQTLVQRLCAHYPEIPASTPVLTTATPNAAEVETFLRSLQTDVVIARCKWILRRGVFEIPRLGTFVMHPGICPEYRNAHGCFWALAMNDRERVGMTLLKVDRGVDTGPVFGYFHCDYDEARDSHIVIQLRTVFDNLDAIRDLLLRIVEGKAQPLDTRGRESKVWGQPWLSALLSWKRRAGRKPG